MYSDRPEDAKRWINIVLYEVSDIIRSQMITERQNYVNYLQQQLSQSSLTTSRDATITILADQYRALMVLKSAKTFPLQQIQPPTRDQFPVNKSVSLFAMYGIVDRADGCRYSHRLRNPRCHALAAIFASLSRSEMIKPGTIEGPC